MSADASTLLHKYEEHRRALYRIVAADRSGNVREMSEAVEAAAALLIATDNWSNHFQHLEAAK